MYTFSHTSDVSRPDFFFEVKDLVFQGLTFCKDLYANFEGRRYRTLKTSFSLLYFQIVLHCMLA